MKDKHMTYNIDISSSTVSIEYIRKYNTLPWNRAYLSRNEGIRMKDVLELDLPNAVDKWSYWQLSKVLPMEDIAGNRSCEWSESMILENKNFDMWIVGTMGGWDWEKLSRKATLESVTLYPHYRWMRSILGLSSIFNIGMVYVEMPNAIDEWNWRMISQVVTMEVVLNHRELPWDRRYLGDHNRHFYVEMMKEDLPNASGEWGMGILSLRPKYETVSQYPLLKWNRSSMVYYRSPIDMRIVDLDLPNAEGSWNWYNLSHMTDMEYVRKNRNRVWDRWQLSTNNRFSLDILDLDMPNAVGHWSWFSISRHATYVDLLERPNLPWDRYGLGDSKNIRDNIARVLMLDLPNATGKWNKDMLPRNLNIEDLVRYPDIPIEYFDDTIIKALGVTTLDWKKINETIPMDMIMKYPFLPWDRDIITRRKDIDYRVLGLDMPRAVGRWFWAHLAWNIPYSDILRYPEMICKLGVQEIMKRNMSIYSILALDFYSNKVKRVTPMHSNGFHDVSFNM